MEIYDINAIDILGKETPLTQYKGKTLLIVNTASKCGFTPQFKELQYLYETYKDKDFVVLGFPSDQFMKQEFNEDEDIHSFCEKNFGVTFPMFSKIHVKGKNIHPLFKFLTNHTNGVLTKDIKWNFTKFLVNKNGEVIGRYSPTVNPIKIETKIQELLS